MAQPLQIDALGNSDASGNISIALPTTPATAQYVGSITIPNAPLTAQFTVNVAGQIYQNLGGPGPFGPFLLLPGQNITINGTGLVVNTPYSLVLQGMQYGLNETPNYAGPTSLGTGILQSGQQGVEVFARTTFSDLTPQTFVLTGSKYPPVFHALLLEVISWAPGGGQPNGLISITVEDLLGNQLFQAGAIFVNGQTLITIPLVAIRAADMGIAIFIEYTDGHGGSIVATGSLSQEILPASQTDKGTVFPLVGLEFDQGPVSALNPLPIGGVYSVNNSVIPFKVDSAGVQYVIPVAPSTSAGDHPPTEKTVVSFFVNTNGQQILGAPGAGLRYRIYSAAISIGGTPISAANYGNIYSNTGSTILAAMVGGENSIWFGESGIPLTTNESINASFSAGSGEIAGTMVVTVETV